VLECINNVTLLPRLRRCSTPLQVKNSCPTWILQGFNNFETNGQAVVGNLWTHEKAYGEILKENRLLRCLFFQH